MRWVLLILAVVVSVSAVAAPPAWSVGGVEKSAGVKVEKRANDTDSSGAKMVRFQYIKVPGYADLNRITVEAVGTPPADIWRVKVAFQRYDDKTDVTVEAVAARIIDTLIGKESLIVQRIQTRWDDKRPGPFTDTINGVGVRVSMAGDYVLVYLDR